MKKQTLEMRWLRDALLCAAIMLSMDVSIAQEPLVMRGIEKIDSKERISGNAVVGFSYKGGCDKSFNPNGYRVYLSAMDAGPPKKLTLTVQVTTVDGRYVFGAKKPDVVMNGSWRTLALERKIEKTTDNKVEYVSLDTEFLNNYNDEQRAIVVSDDVGRVYPVVCGCQKKSQEIRIKVNAEGADAYFPKIVDGKKRKLVPCTRVDQGSTFKFDHYCDIGEHDMKNVENYPILRKRGATFDNPIEVRTVLPKANSC
jgi:hypothetical protein